MRCDRPLRRYWLSLSLLLSACGQSPPPPASEAVAAPLPRAEATELRDAVKAPLDKANEVEQTLQNDADATRQAIDDAGG